jgi:CheY-like chemotaxis protein
VIEYGGSGLGLFIARLLSRLQGGEIGVSSKEGLGSIFAFFIRVRRVPTPHGNDVHISVPEINMSVGSVNPNSPGLNPIRSPPRPCSDFTILIVEDNLVNQRVLQKQLINCGFGVRIANNGLEAVEFVKMSHFWRGHENGLPLALVLMDIEMPVMNGTEATRCIRLLETEGHLETHVPIIAITANARVEQIAVARESGMDDVVSKPFRITELLEKMQMFVGPLIKIGSRK